MKSNFKLTVIEFTAFNSEGEKFFISDLSDENGNGKIIIEDSKTTPEDAIKSLKNLCSTVQVHKVIEYDLQVIGKTETILEEKFKPTKQLEHAA